MQDDVLARELSAFRAALLHLWSGKKGAQKALADYLGFKEQSKVCNWMTRAKKVPREYLESIARFYNVTEDFLLGRDQIPPSTPPATTPDGENVMPNHHQCFEALCKLMQIHHDPEDLCRRFIQITAAELNQKPQKKSQV